MTAEPTWEAAWEVEFPASSPEELALALVVRDLLHGTSFDIEGADGGPDLALDYIAGDELEGTTYRLLVTAEATGSPDADVVRDVTERLLDQLVDEAESLMEQRAVLAVEKAEALGFRSVAEDQERWDLIVPDWLAPDGAEVPFGFRPVLLGSGRPWPTDEQLDGHGRIVVVPFGGELQMIAIPSPPDETEDEPAPDSLPILP
jgi:hypothetical protein